MRLPDAIGTLTIIIGADRKATALRRAVRFYWGDHAKPVRRRLKFSETIVDAKTGAVILHGVRVVSIKPWPLA